MIFRKLQKSEYDLLKDFLYEAIFIPEGVKPPDRSIIERPELAVYYERFGEGPGDHCVAADDDGLVVGVIWSRIMDDYGHVDDDTPSLAMAVHKDYRGQGIGTNLMKEMKNSCNFVRGTARLDVMINQPLFGFLLRNIYWIP